MSLLDARTVYKPFRYPWAYEAYKQQQRIHWLPEEVPLREDVRDWNQNLSANEKNLLTQIFRFFTQGDCYHPDTEFLTDRGWVKCSDVTLEDKIAQFNSSGIINFTFPLRVVAKEYTGPLYHIKDGRAKTEQLVTDNHKVVYWYRDEMRTTTAAKFIPYQGVKLRTSGYTVGTIHNLTPLERLWIAFQADGNVKEGVDGSRLGYTPHRFAFKKKRKADRLEWILSECGIEYEEQHDGEYYRYYVKYPTGKMQKDFSWVELGDISTSYARQFIEELSYWDGSSFEDGLMYYYNTNKDAVDVVQAIAIMTDAYHTYQIKEEERSEAHSTGYRISFHASKDGDVDGQSLRRNSTIVENYSGKVHCVTMPQGTVVTRYNNRVAFSGNCDVAQGYLHKYIPIFGHQPELAMMLASFASMEAVHVDAYSLLLDTVGMPETEYEAFAKYQAMVDKHEYLREFDPLDYTGWKDSQGQLTEIAKSLAVYSAFTEGLQLFSSFAILLNFPRHNKMKGMGQIVTWSIRDESLHVESMIKLFETFINEHPEIWHDDFKKELYDICRDMVSLEEAFIDLAFEQGGVEGLTPEEVKRYVHYIADRRLLQLGLKPNYGVKTNPLPWIDEMVTAVEHANFFETRATEYSRGICKW